MEEQLKKDLYAAHDACGDWDPYKIRDWAQAHPESALYKRIEWNVEKAALEYQLSQLRGLIAQVKVLPRDKAEDGTVNVRSILSTPTGTRQREYVDRDVVMNQKEMLLQVRIEAWKNCVTRIANIGATGDAGMLQMMRVHLAQLEAELSGKAA